MKPIPEHLKSKFEELKRTLTLIPKSKRKAAVQKGLELARLKKEREELLKSLTTSSSESKMLHPPRHEEIHSSQNPAPMTIVARPMPYLTFETPSRLSEYTPPPPMQSPTEKEDPL